jgi:hypothetical protein
VVPDGVEEDSGARLTVTGKVSAVNEDGTVRVDLTATSGGEKVLGLARALVRLP